MVGWTGYRPNKPEDEPIREERGGNDKKFIPGYKGFVPMVKSQNIFG